MQWLKHRVTEGAEIKQFSLKSLLIMFFVLTLLTAYFREPLIRLVRTSQLPYELIESDRDYEKMLSEQNAFVFVKADWSLNSVFAQREVDKFAADWSWFNRDPKVKFYLIDITDSKGQLNAYRWADSDESLKHAYGGYGSAIWLRDGRVLQVKHGMECTLVDLAEHTEELFRN